LLLLLLTHSVSSVQFQFQPLIALVGLGHLLRCFWYQLAEMYGLAQLGHLKSQDHQLVE